MKAALGVVLAGGRSSRMGRDKALVELDGRPLVEHALALLRTCCAEVAIAGSRPDLARFAPVLPDVHVGSGPLGGMEAALMHASASGFEQAVFLPVDLPLMSPALFALMLERSALTGALATLPTLLGRPQPLCSVLRAEMLPAMTAALDAGEYKVMRAFERLARGKLDLFSIEAVAAARGDLPGDSPVHRWFDNANTPEELAHLERISSRGRASVMPAAGIRPGAGTLVSG